MAGESDQGNIRCLGPSGRRRQTSRLPSQAGYRLDRTRSGGTVSTDFFARVARDIATTKERPAISLRKHRDELRSELQVVERDIITAESAATRASIYPITAGQSMCPVCWMAGRDGAYLGPMGGGTDNADFFRCSTCGNQFEVPFR